MRFLLTIPSGRPPVEGGNCKRQRRRSASIGAGNVVELRFRAVISDANNWTPASAKTYRLLSHHTSRFTAGRCGDLKEVQLYPDKIVAGWNRVHRFSGRLQLQSVKLCFRRLHGWKRHREGKEAVQIPPGWVSGARTPAVKISWVLR